MNPLALAQGGIGLIQALAGLFGRRKANKLAKQNPFPVEQMPQEVLDNQAMAKAKVNTGLSGVDYNNTLNQIKENTATAMAGARDRRSAGDVVNAVQQNENKAATGLNVADATARENHQNQLMTVNNQVAATKRSLFDVNQREQYREKAQRVNQMFGAANSNLTQGVDNIGTSAVMQFSNDFGYNGSNMDMTGDASGATLPANYTDLLMMNRLFNRRK